MRRRQEKKPGVRRVVVEKIGDTAPQGNLLLCEQALPGQRINVEKGLKESMLFFLFFLFLLMQFVSQDNHDGESQGQ